MKKTAFSLLIIFWVIAGTRQTANAQYLLNNDSAFKAKTPMTGHLWGYVFGDAYYKGSADTLGRGGAQYSGVPKNRTAFQIRRAYLGYDFNINQKISTEVLLEATNSETLSDSKMAFYVKLANLRVKDLWKGTDLVLGQISTPGFAMSSEPLWGYRSIEKTQIDVRGTPSYDLGAALQGKFDPKTGNFGYDLMVANGNGAKQESDNYKWLYSDIWGKFFDKHLYVNLYADYNQMSPINGLKHSRNMFKGFVAYTIPTFTVGVEGYINNLKNDDQATEISTGNVDVLSVKAKGISVFARGALIKNKLNFFARYDASNPNDKIDNSKYSKYVGNTSGYNDPNTKDQFITAGLDFTPDSKVHFMPNVWIDSHKNQGPVSKYNASDVVYRLTFYYIFGK
ncbi:hypothetical protein [Arachidicoccus sp.]|uniref:hypothetical protein n=1 Tax=Arachidicoccus sp. TaxID=1872624 RepID=UPI003D1F6B90